MNKSRINIPAIEKKDINTNKNELSICPFCGCNLGKEANLNGFSVICPGCKSAL